MDNKQKLQMLHAKFVNNYNKTPKIKEGFVGGGYKIFLQAKSDNMLKQTKLVGGGIVKDEFN